MSAHKYCHEEKERRRWQDPEALLGGLGLKHGMTFVDIGCGDGFFTFPAARFVGNKGRVYGIDADDGAIGRMKQKALKEDLKLELGGRGS